MTKPILDTMRRTAFGLRCGVALSIAPTLPAWAQAGDLIVAVSTFSEETMTPWQRTTASSQNHA